VIHSSLDVLSSPLWAWRILWRRLTGLEVLVWGFEQRVRRPLDKHLERLFAIANKECDEVVNGIAVGIRLCSGRIDHNDENQITDGAKNCA
jgi:hypothetical protein